MLQWDQIGDKVYSMGVDRGVLYLPNTEGIYNFGVAWNGLTNLSESPSGAEETALWADNIKYATLRSKEEFGGTIEAYTYPDEFAECDGSATPMKGMKVGQQARKSFGLAYRTKLGNDVDGEDHGYELHLVYGATANPSEKSYGTINDSPEAITFSWEFTTIPVEVGEIDGIEYKSSSYIVLNSVALGKAKMKAIEDILYGAKEDPRLPLPSEIYQILSDVKSSDKQITSFVIGDAEGKIDEKAHTVSITVPAGTDVTSLKPVIKVSEKATVSPASGAEQDFTSPVTYTVTAEDSSVQEYVVTVTAPVVNKNYIKK